MSNTNKVVREHCEALQRVVSQELVGQVWEFERVSQNRHIKLRAVEQRTNAVAILTVPVSPGDSRRGILNWVSSARNNLRLAVERKGQA